MDNEQEIQRIVSELDDSFTDLLCQLKEELKLKEVSQVTQYLRDRHLSYLSIEDLKGSNDCTELIDEKLDKYYDFLDCAVLTTIAKKFASSTLFESFTKYSKRAQDFRETKSVGDLRKCLQDMFRPHINNLDNAPQAHIDLQNAWSDMNIDKLRTLVKRFFPMSDRLALTKHIKITSASVHITYFMSESKNETQEIVEQLRNELSFMSYIGVCRLKVTGETIFQDENRSKIFIFEFAFLEAAAAGHDKAVGFLLDHVASDSALWANTVTITSKLTLKIKNQIVEVPLETLKKDTALTKLLLSYPEITSWSALSAASHNGHQKVTKLLLKKKANPNIRNNDGRTALMAASQNGHHQVVELLLKEKADPNIRNNDGRTALMAASQNGHHQVVELLLKEKADPNIKDNDGWTALMVASLNGHQQVVELPILKLLQIQHKPTRTILSISTKTIAVDYEISIYLSEPMEECTSFLMVDAIDLCLNF